MPALESYTLKHVCFGSNYAPFSDQEQSCEIATYTERGIEATNHRKGDYRMDTVCGEAQN